jgi:hypothetical protein
VGIVNKDKAPLGDSRMPWARFVDIYDDIGYMSRSRINLPILWVSDWPRRE